MMVMAFPFKGVFGLERTVTPARTLTATPNPAIYQPAPQSAGRISCHPADRKPAVNGNDFPDYDQNHLLKTQESEFRIARMQASSKHS
jgi:hypothetical protein